jgi:putative transposon-encoded protein
MKISQITPKKMKRMVLEITPYITGILKDVRDINKLRGTSGEISEEEAADRGVDVITGMIDMLFVRQYDGIIKIISVLFEKTVDEIENTPMSAIVDMVKEIIGDRVITSFFPRLRRLVPTTPSDT